MTTRKELLHKYQNLWALSGIGVGRKCCFDAYLMLFMSPSLAAAAIEGTGKLEARKPVLFFARILSSQCVFSQTQGEGTKGNLKGTSPCDNQLPVRQLGRLG